MSSEPLRQFGFGCRVKVDGASLFMWVFSKERTFNQHGCIVPFVAHLSSGHGSKLSHQDQGTADSFPFTRATHFSGVPTFFSHAHVCVCVSKSGGLWLALKPAGPKTGYPPTNEHAT